MCGVGEMSYILYACITHGRILAVGVKLIVRKIDKLRIYIFAVFLAFSFVAFDCENTRTALRSHTVTGTRINLVQTFSSSLLVIVNLFLFSIAAVGRRIVVSRFIRHNDPMCSVHTSVRLFDYHISGRESELWLYFLFAPPNVVYMYLLLARSIAIHYVITTNKSH